MGLEAEQDNDATARLIAAGRALLAQGGDKFPLTRLCTEAGVEIADFRKSFASKAALLQALMEPAKAEPASAPAPVADAWLERRLRVFERALNALEERAEKERREHALAIAKLEERLALLEGVPVAARVEVPAEPQPQPQTEVEQQIFASEEAQPELAPDPETPAPFQLEPLEPATIAKADAEFLEPARRAAQERARELEQKPAPRRLPWRLFAMTGLAVLTLALGAGITFVHADRATIPAGESTAYRAVAATPLAHLTARADSGDAAAESALAFAYLRGNGLAHDDAAAARWAEAAALLGDANAQYLIGSLTLDGAGVPRDPTQAFAWFKRAAAVGQLKAMHNLAIAYAEGEGVPKDAAAAAEWFAHAAMGGYVDSAFDLAVLYERGEGVPQSPKDALRWYKVAAKAGDAPAAARAHLLESEGRF